VAIPPFECSCDSGIDGQFCDVDEEKVGVAGPVLTMLVLMSFFGVNALGLLYWAILKCYFPDNENGIVTFLAYNLGAFGVDVLFMVAASYDPLLLAVTVAAYILGMVANSLAFAYFYVKHLRRSLGSTSEVRAAARLILILVPLNPELFALSRSSLFRSRYLMGDWPPHSDRILQLLGITSNIMIDLPMLVLKLIFAEVETLTTFLLIVVLSSALPLLFGVTKRLILLLVIHFGRSSRAQREALDEQELQALTTAENTGGQISAAPEGPVAGGDHADDRPADASREDKGEAKSEEE